MLRLLREPRHSKVIIKRWRQRCRDLCVYICLIWVFVRLTLQRQLSLWIVCFLVRRGTENLGDKDEEVVNTGKRCGGKQMWQMHADRKEDWKLSADIKGQVSWQTEGHVLMNVCTLYARNHIVKRSRKGPKTHSEVNERKMESKSFPQTKHGHRAGRLIKILGYEF